MAKKRKNSPKSEYVHWTPPSPSAKPWQERVMDIAMLACVMGALVLAYLLVTDFRATIASQNYHPILGKTEAATSATYQTFWSGGHYTSPHLDTFSASQASYSYVVDGKTYAGTASRSLFGNRTFQTILALPEQSSITVYYDPQSPTHSAIRNGFHLDELSAGEEIFLFFSLAYCALAVGAVILWLGFKLRPQPKP